MDLESTKLQLEDEIEAKVELQKLLIKIQEETRHLRDRLEKEIESKNEEIEDQRFNYLLTKYESSFFLNLDVNLMHVLMKFKNNLLKFLLKQVILKKQNNVFKVN
jgi:uncharacterized Fe-S cluster-containing protein